MTWHISGGQGIAPENVLDQMTQGLGFPLRRVTEAVVSAIDRTVDGVGVIEDDLNAMDFTVQDGTTYHEILPQDYTTFYHNEVVYQWLGPKNVRVGVGGDYTAQDSDFAPVGTADHNLLVSRDAADQHPMSAVTGLGADQDRQDQALTDHVAAPDPHPQYTLETEALSTFQFCAYGGLRYSSAIGFSLTGSFTTIPTDEVAIAEPLRITQDTLNTGLRLEHAGVYAGSVSLVLEVNSGSQNRFTNLRLWNDNKNVALSSELPLGVGRQQELLNISSGVFLFEVPTDAVGDLILLQIGGGDNITVSSVICSWSFRGAGLVPALI